MHEAYPKLIFSGNSKISKIPLSILHTHVSMPLPSPTLRAWDRKSQAKAQHSEGHAGSALPRSGWTQSVPRGGHTVNAHQNVWKATKRNGWKVEESHKYSTWSISCCVLAANPQWYGPQVVVLLVTTCSSSSSSTTTTTTTTTTTPITTYYYYLYFYFNLYFYYYCY